MYLLAWSFVLNKLSIRAWNKILKLHVVSRLLLLNAIAILCMLKRFTELLKTH